MQNILQNKYIQQTMSIYKYYEHSLPFNDTNEVVTFIQKHCSQHNVTRIELKHLVFL